MNGNRAGTRLLPTQLWAGALGALFAMCLYFVWGLEGRWFVIAIVGAAMVSISMTFAGRFSDFLLVSLLFSVPLAGFTKWLLLDGYPTRIKNPAPLSGAMGIGVTDFIVAGLYVAWAFRIFVSREEPLPKFEKTDIWAGLLVLACMLSLWGAQDQLLGWSALEHLVKHVLIYFYVSRHFKHRHIRWFLASIVVALLLESAVGVVQNQFGLLRGLILDKGAGSELINEQYAVPGIEDINRATGTTYDSHALGLYLAMLVPYMLVFAYARDWTRQRRAFAGLLALLGLAVVVITYSRSAWLSSAVSSVAVFAVLLAWRERFVGSTVIGIIVAGIASGPWVIPRLFSRFFTAPTELVAGRFDQFAPAWDIWRENVLFGTGAGNYMLELNTHNIGWAFDAPVHNVPMYIGSELGLFGIIAYFGLIAIALHSFWRLIRQRREPASRLALAAFAGILAYLFDGMSDPQFREPTVYLMFWITMGLSVALGRLDEERLPAPESARS